MTVAIAVSVVVSLTLTPMLCSRFLKAHGENRQHGRLFMLFERGFNAMHDRATSERCASCWRTSR